MYCRYHINAVTLKNLQSYNISYNENINSPAASTSNNNHITIKFTIVQMNQ